MDREERKKEPSMWRDRRGMYIVEACIVMPVFIAAVLIMIQIIPVLSTCEDVTYSVADEMQLEGIKSCFREERGALPASVMLRGRNGRKSAGDLRITSYRYLYQEGEQEDLISLGYEIDFHRAIAFYRFRKVRFRSRVTSRAFTGSIHEVPGGSGGRRVYIFPERGEKYHSEDCRYVRANYRETYLTQEVKRKYHACPLCKSGGLRIGESVVLFERAGEAYHRKNCRSVDRCYIETTQKEAVDHGYHACSICGGG